MRRVALVLAVLAWIAVGQDTGFRAFDVYIDAGPSGLAAWQVEVVVSRGRAAIVGVEGGAPAAYAEPAHYDPAALHGDGRIVLAAFTTDARPPSGRVRVARLHFHEQGDAPVEYAIRALAAAAPGGKKIKVEVSLVSSGEKK